MGYDDDAADDLTKIAEYRYDSQGRRIEYTDLTRDVTTRYYYDGANVIAEYSYTSGWGWNGDGASS